MVTIKNGQEIDGVLKSIEIEWTNKDETTSTMSLSWEEVDVAFIQALKAFLIRKYKDQ